MKTEVKDSNAVDGNGDDVRELLPRFRTSKSAGVKTWLRGVFEGGGAKGIAYRGALEAVKEQGCWFEGVAGSSAGAITAALIAAGYLPHELDMPMNQLLELFRPPKFFKILGNLRRTGEIFSSDAFRDRLNKLLLRNSKLFGAKIDESGLTFKELYDATGVDLYVVAADISRKQPIVFHHLYTPKCQVADAVLASASIPFAFDGGMLTSKASLLSPNPSEGRKVQFRIFRTIVDGGVWVNFPMFVFTDPVFQNYMLQALGLDREEAAKPAGPVVGFLLHELVDDEGGEKDDQARLRETKAAYLEARFERGTPLGSSLAPIEQTEHPMQSIDSPTLAPKSGVQWRFGPNAPRWPNPKKELNRTLLVLAYKSLAYASQLGMVITMIIGVILAELFLLIVPGIMIWEAFQNSLERGGWELIGTLILATLFASFYVSQLFAVAVLFGGAIFSNWVLSLPARRVLHGLASTLVASPGTSQWEHLHSNVIALPIPKYLTTLKAPDDPDLINDVFQRAMDVTKRRLPEILKAFADRQGS